MSIKKLLALLMALALVLTMFAGCGKKDKDDEKENDESVVDQIDEDEDEDEDEDDKDENADDEEETDEDEESDEAGFPKKLTATKNGSFSFDEDATSIFAYKGGFVYNIDSKYGVVSFDGENDTGAKYDFCEADEMYFVAGKNYTQDFDDIDSINALGLIDGNGKTLVPMEFAKVEVLNEYYAKAIEVTKITDDEDEAIIYFYSGIVSFSPSDEDTLFEGKWCIYDLTTGEKVEDLSGKYNTSITAKGKYLTYQDSDGDYISTDASGKKLPKSARLFDNGFYCDEEGSGYAVYDVDGEEVFTVDYDGYIPYNNAGDEYYFARKEKDSKYSYALMDNKGNVISDSYDEYFELRGNAIEFEDKLYNFDGDLIAEGTYDSISNDEFTGEAYILKNGKIIKVVDSQGNVLMEETEDDDLAFDSDANTFRKDSEDGYKFYCIKSKKYSVEGRDIAGMPWVILVEADNNTYEVVEVISGKTLIEGYNSYKVAVVDGEYYIYASRTSGKTDIYLITPTA